MTTKLQQQLFEKYPDLFQNKNKSMRESAMFWGIDIGDGWYKLVDELCADIMKVAPNTVVDQVKEKFGQLAFFCKLK